MPMRQRKETQEMLRFLIFLTLGACTLSAAVLPEEFTGYRRVNNAAVSVEDRAIWSEYGLEEAERGDYTAGSRKLTVTAYRMKDPTGAHAAFQWQRSPNAASAGSSANVAGGKLAIFANYLVNFTGSIQSAEQDALFSKLPRIVRSSPPPLTAYLPLRGRVSNSERYVLGAASLSRFEPRISSALAAFERGAEAQLGRYRAGSKEIQVAIFSYPTPQMAIERYREFQKLPDSAVRRSGPILAVGFPAGKDTEAVLERVTYSPKLSWTEHVPKDTVQDAAQMLLAICTLAGILILASVAFGMVFGGVRIARGKFGLQTADHLLTTLHLDDK
jgi:hypothetical protein